MLAVFFDIDGTLLETGGAGGTAMRGAFTQAFGVAEPARVPYSGRTDRAIGAALFAAHGLDDNADNWLELRRVYLAELARQLPCHEGEVLPGAMALVESLRGRPQVELGLLTGNLQPAADLKLEHYGLGGLFDFGGFGDEFHQRDDVAQAALESACRHTGTEPTRNIVIGDTPLDVSCARSIGADVIAVATGIHSRDELAASNPDLLLDSLADLGPVIEFCELD